MKLFNIILLSTFGLLSLASFAAGQVIDPEERVRALSKLVNRVRSVMGMLPSWHINNFDEFIHPRHIPNLPHAATVEELEEIDFLVKRDESAASTTVTIPTSTEIPVENTSIPVASNDSFSAVSAIGSATSDGHPVSTEWPGKEKHYSPMYYADCSVGKSGWWCQSNRGTWCSEGVMMNKWALNQGRGDCNDRSGHCSCPDVTKQIEARKDDEVLTVQATLFPTILNRQVPTVTSKPNLMSRGASQYAKKALNTHNSSVTPDIFLTQNTAIDTVSSMLNATSTTLLLAAAAETRRAGQGSLVAEESPNACLSNETLY